MNLRVTAGWVGAVVQVDFSLMAYRRTGPHCALWPTGGPTGLETVGVRQASAPPNGTARPTYMRAGTAPSALMRGIHSAAHTFEHVRVMFLKNCAQCESACPSRLIALLEISLFGLSCSHGFVNGCRGAFKLVAVESPGCGRGSAQGSATRATRGCGVLQQQATGVRAVALCATPEQQSPLSQASLSLETMWRAASCRPHL